MIKIHSIIVIRKKFPNKYVFYRSNRPSRVTWLIARVVSNNSYIEFNKSRRNV